MKICQAADKTTEEPANDLYHPTKFNSPVSWQRKGWKVEAGSVTKFQQVPIQAKAAGLCAWSFQKKPKPSQAKHASAYFRRTNLTKGRYPRASQWQDPSKRRVLWMICHSGVFFRLPLSCPTAGQH